MLSYTCSLLVGALPPSPGRTADGEKIGHSQRRQVRRAGRLEGDAPSGAGMTLPLGTATALLDSLLAGRAPPHRPNWPRSSPTSPVPFRLMPLLDQPATKYGSHGGHQIRSASIIRSTRSRARAQRNLAQCLEGIDEVLAQPVRLGPFV